MALNINGRMKVKTLRADFLKEFGLTLRVYDGRNFADDEATLASIRKGDNKGGGFSPKRNTKVGNLEDKIMDMFGIKTQVAGSDDSYLCNNDLTLAAALDEDDKKMGRKEKKANNSELSNEVRATDSKPSEEIKNFYKITVRGTGGEFTLGVVDDEDAIELLHEKADEDDLLAENENDVTEASYFNYSDIVDVYGPAISVSNVEVDQYSDSEYENYQKTVFDEDAYKITYVTIDCPRIVADELNNIHDENDLIFGAHALDKGCQSIFNLEIDEVFDSNKLYFGTVNLDETYGDWEIVTEAYYFTDKDITIIWKKYLEENNNNERILAIDNQGEMMETLMEDYGNDFLSNELINMIKELELDLESEGSETEGYSVLLYDINGNAIVENWY